jgi:predicted permease
MKWADAFRRRQSQQDLNDEIEVHIAIEVQRRIERGESPDAARTAALREIGSMAAVAEAIRDVWFWGTFDRLMQDLRYALRTLRKTPVFTTVGILSLALGIGANAAIFSIINAVLLQTLPVRNPDELVILTSFQRNRVGNFAYPDYERLRDRARSFTGVLGASFPAIANIGTGDETSRAQVQMISGNYFSVLGVGMVLGRPIDAGDDNSSVAVISHSFWQKTFGGNSNAIGKSLNINGNPAIVVGVAPPEFAGESVGQPAEIWVPFTMQQSVRPTPIELRNVRFVTWLYLMGRLKPGVSMQTAQAEMESLIASIREEFRTDKNDYLQRIVLEPGRSGSGGLRQSFSSVLLLSMAIVAFVLLIACANLAGLLLERGASRRGELAARLALGATRGRLIRQLLTESLLLAGFGAAAGLWIGALMNRFLLRVVSEGAGFRIVNAYASGRVFLFCAVIAVATAIAIGLGPALRGARIDPGPNLKLHTRAFTGSTERRRARSVLIAFQVAMTFILLAVGFLFTRTIYNLKSVDTGFQAENVLLAGIGSHDQRGEANRALLLMERLVAIPGVESASVSVNIPLGNAGSGVNGLEFGGYTSQNEDDHRARADWVGPRYLETLRLPLVHGREFSFADTADSQKVAVVNETTERHYFGSQSAIGRHFRFNGIEYEIIGVARDAKYRDLRESTPRMIYFALLQSPAELHAVEVRTTGSPALVSGAVRETVRQVDTRLNISEIATMSSIIDRKLTPEFLAAQVSGFFSGLTMLLVSIGIYGTLAFIVAGRTNEIGIRIALGASPAVVVGMVLRNVVRPVAVGIGAGVLVVLAAGPVLGSLLFGVKAYDPATILLAVLVLSLVALAAAYIPARRASRVDAVAALRAE